MTSKEAHKLIKLCEEQLKRTKEFQKETSKIVRNASVNTTMNAVYIRPDADFRDLCKALGINYGLQYTRGEEGMSIWLTARYKDINIKCYKGAIQDDSSTEND